MEVDGHQERVVKEKEVGYRKNATKATMSS
jgi:hypothetical protein